MQIGVLTSSMADFGIYLPLLKEIKNRTDFSCKLIVFGTHLSKFHGYSIEKIRERGFEIDYTIENVLAGDSPEAVASSMGMTTMKFGLFWAEHQQEFDVVFCLGDRFEMFSAVIAAIPFNIKFAHLHGGEITSGAIDNIFRNSISLASSYHFVAAQGYKQRLTEILGSDHNIYDVGSLSLENIDSLAFLSKEEFYDKWNVDFEKPTILLTFHPETIEFTKNEFYAYQIVSAIKKLPRFQFLITLPNSDTSGTSVRKIFMNELNKLDYVYLFESLGTEGYFSAMKHCSFLLGNTSSGIIEAASFGKHVINLGRRQAGRLHSENLHQSEINEHEIIEMVHKVASINAFAGRNIFYKKDVAKNILKDLKAIKLV